MSAAQSAPRDLAVIGAGPGGYVAAIVAAQRGASVTLIEESELGGTCLNLGCIPSKTFLRSGQLLHLMERAGEFGLQYEGGGFDLGAIVARKDRVVNQFRQGIAGLMKRHGVEVLRGRGRLTSRTAIEVKTDAGTVGVNAKHIFLAPGSVANRLPIPGADAKEVVTSDDLVTLADAPDSIVIIGAGAVGLEYASYFNALGTEVHVVEVMPQVLPYEDAEIAEALARAMKKLGVNILTEVKVKEIVADGAGRAVVCETKTGEQRLHGDLVLLGVGRGPNTKDLGLDAAGVTADPRGYIRVSDTMQSSAEGVYAFGDAVQVEGLDRHPQLAHLASAEGKTAAWNVTGKPSRSDYTAVPGPVFCLPEVASVGLNEAQAAAQGLDTKVGRFLFRANSKAVAIGEIEGLVKVVLRKDDGRIVGVQMLGPETTDLIAQATLAVTAGLTADQIDRVIFAHPTLSEAFAEAVADAAGHAVHK